MCRGNMQCEQEIASLLNIANDPSIQTLHYLPIPFIGRWFPFGLIDTCTRYCNNFEDSKLEEKVLCKTLCVTMLSLPYTGANPATDHHSVIQIEFNDDGDKAYLDQGAIGGDDHVIFPDEIPADCTVVFPNVGDD